MDILKYTHTCNVIIPKTEYLAEDETQDKSSASSTNQKATFLNLSQTQRDRLHGILHPILQAKIFVF